MKDLTAVREAFVPLVKMTFDNVDIDLLFAQVQHKKVTEHLDLLDNNILRGCEADDIKSLNGCRVTNKIHGLVPEIKTFQTTLRCIKLWAKNRGVYSNVLGYPGGVAWALLVAKVCISHPKLQPNQLLSCFFKYFRDYNWSHSNPVTLEEPIANDSSLVGFPIPEDLFYVQKPNQNMPIITPAFPAQNATHNISSSTKNVILTELEKASIVTDALVQPGAAQDPTLSWGRVFKKFPFFKAFQHFIEIQILSKTVEDHGKW